MSARVLFACWPFEGHLFPQLSIAAAVRERGGEAAFYTDRGLGALVEAEGMRLFPFEAVDPAWRRVRARERAVGGRRQSLRVARQAFRDWLVDTIPAQVEDLRRAIAEWAPEVIVTDASMWGPSLVLAEADSIAVALASPLIYAAIPGPGAPPLGSGLAPASNARERAVAATLRGIGDALGRDVRREIDRLRERYGLGPLGCRVNEHMGRLPLYLVLSVPALDYGRADLPAGVRYVGSCLWHPPHGPTDDAWLDAIPRERPWVHVTDGTSHFQDPFVLRAAVAGLADAELEVIIVHGRERRQAEFAPAALPANIHLRQWVSHEALLPRCAALVTTGGAGSTIAALRAGIPLVLVPTTWDKPDNARRVAEAGAGVVLKPRRCSPRALRAAIEEVLGEPSYREAAQRCARELAQAGGPGGAAELIAALARERAPMAGVRAS